MVSEFFRKEWHPFTINKKCMYILVNSGQSKHKTTSKAACKFKMLKCLKC